MLQMALHLNRSQFSAHLRLYALELRLGRRQESVALDSEVAI